MNYRFDKTNILCESDLKLSSDLEDTISYKRTNAYKAHMLYKDKDFTRGACKQIICLDIYLFDDGNKLKRFKVYKIKIETEEQQANFNNLQHEDIDFWRKPLLINGVAGLAMVAPSYFDWFEEKLDELNVAKDIIIEDVYEYLNEKEDSVQRSKSVIGRQFDFNGYYRYDEILNHLEQLQQTQTTTSVTVNIVDYGTTVENRRLVYLQINSTTAEKPIVVIEAGINPREWITIPAALNIVDRVLGQDSIYLDYFDWIVIPVLNPDGYEYTHTNDRLWTKTLSTFSDTGFICPGANINRNFDIDWQNFESSSSPCSHLYAGIEPFSEIESRLVRSIIQDYGSRIRLYISLQNNGGFVSYPWSYEFAASGLFIQHHLLGLNMVNAMEGNYLLGISSNNFGRISGTSADYAQENGVLYSYNIDIVQGADSVIIPESDIVNIVEDVWRAVTVAVNNFV